MLSYLVEKTDCWYFWLPEWGQIASHQRKPDDVDWKVAPSTGQTGVLHALLFTTWSKYRQDIIILLIFCRLILGKHLNIFAHYIWIRKYECIHFSEHKEPDSPFLPWLPSLHTSHVNRTAKSQINDNEKLSQKQTVRGVMCFNCYNATWSMVVQL